MEGEEGEGEEERADEEVLDGEEPMEQRPTPEPQVRPWCTPQCVRLVCPALSEPPFGRGLSVCACRGRCSMRWRRSGRFV